MSVSLRRPVANTPRTIAPAGYIDAREITVRITAAAKAVRCAAAGHPCERSMVEMLRWSNVPTIQDLREPRFAELPHEVVVALTWLSTVAGIGERCGIEVWPFIESAADRS